jgi:hypothetical protein
MFPRELGGEDCGNEPGDPVASSHHPGEKPRRHRAVQRAREPDVPPELWLHQKEPEVDRQCRSGKDDQPPSCAVFRSEQPGHDGQAEQVPRQVRRIEMDEMCRQQAPGLPRQHGRALVSQRRDRRRAAQRQ